MDRAAKARMRPILRLAFGAIALMWLVAEVGSYVRSREIASDVWLIGSNSLVSIRLVERMGMDVERRRFLVDEHIFESRPEAMAGIEGAIDANRRDYASAAREYDPLSTYPGEADARGRLEADVAAIDAPIDEVLALSRQNDDTAARARLRALEPKFEAIEKDVARLVDINHDAALRAQARIHELQVRDTAFHVVLTLLAVVATLVLGAWITRVVSRHEHQLRVDAAELEQKNRELDAFAGRVAHDLRGPLGTISMAAATLAKQAPEEATVGILRRGVARMDGLIENLLKLSRVGGAAPDAVAEPRAVAAAVEEELRRRVSEVDGTLRVDVEAARVRCDEGLLRDVLWNLAENAIKYRREGVRASIEMTGRARSDVYELRITDNGSGMSPDDASHAFEPFFRGRRALSTAGTGLGLSIVKRVVEANGGKVALRSREGEGTTFVVELPLARPSRPPARAEKAIEHRPAGG
jgi:signal transduction histidine kinase